MTAPALQAFIQGQGAASADNLNTFLQGCDNFTQLRAFTGFPGMQVYVKGAVTPGDNGQGSFYWLASSTAPDNGLTVIRPAGTATGAWIRLGGSLTIGDLSIYDTVAALQGSIVAASVSAVYLLGYYLAGDGGAGAIYTRSLAPGAGAGKVQSADGQWWILASPQLDVRMFGAVGNFGATDDTASILAAVTFASANSRPLFVPGLTFQITPASPYNNEGGTPYLGAFPFASNLEINGAVGSTFKIADGVSTTGTPVPMAMFWTNGVVSNISIRGLTMDMNGANNLISPSAPTSYNRFNQAQIVVTGTGSISTATASDVVLERNRFINTPGVSCVVMGQSNEAGSQLGSGWTLRDNEFVNNGNDTDDHSSVFGWAEDVLADHNLFTSTTPWGTSGTAGPNTAFEIHGARTKFINNTIVGYLQGLWLATNVTNPVSDVLVHGNTFKTLFFGASTFRELSNEAPLSGVLVTNNDFNFDDTAVTAVPALDLKQAVTIVSQYAVNGISVRGNRILKTGTTIASTFFNIGASSVAGQLPSGIIVSGNDGDGLSIGTIVSTNATNGLGDITITDNNWTNLTPAGIYAYPIGDLVNLGSGGPIASLTLGGGSVVDVRASPLTDYGIYIAGTGTITQLNMLAATFVGVQTADIAEAGPPIITYRRGLPEAGFYTGAASTAGASAINTLQGFINTEVLSTAAGAAFTETITNPNITVNSQVFISLAKGTNSAGAPIVSTVTPGAGSVVVVIQNVAPSAALNGTVVIHYRVFNP